MTNSLVICLLLSIKLICLLKASIQLSIESVTIPCFVESVVSAVAVFTYQVLAPSSASDSSCVML